MNVTANGTAPLVGVPTDPRLPPRQVITARNRSAWQGLTDEQLRAAGVEVVRWVDVERKLSYVVYAQSGTCLPTGKVRWEGLDEPLNVAWVRETALKGKRAGQTEPRHRVSGWVLTTDVTLRAV